MSVSAGGGAIVREAIASKRTPTSPQETKRRRLREKRQVKAQRKRAKLEALRTLEGFKKEDEEDPLTISLDRSIELIKIKIQADKDRLIFNFEGDPLIQVLNGRYGPFIQVTPKEGKKINIKIPKGKDPKELTREECLHLLESK